MDQFPSKISKLISELISYWNRWIFLPVRPWQPWQVFLHWVDWTSVQWDWREVLVYKSNQCRIWYRRIDSQVLEEGSNLQVSENLLLVQSERRWKKGDQIRQSVHFPSHWKPKGHFWNHQKLDPAWFDFVVVLTKLLLPLKAQHFLHCLTSLQSTLHLSWSTEWGWLDLDSVWNHSQQERLNGVDGVERWVLLNGERQLL